MHVHSANFNVQNMVEAGPSVENRPNDEKMSAVKGCNVHKQVPIQVNVEQLAGCWTSAWTVESKEFLLSFIFFQVKTGRFGNI